MKILVIVLALTACGPRTHIAEQQFVDCLKADVKSAVPSLLPTVETILSSGVSNWQAQLTALGSVAGKDALACAVQAAEQAFLAKLGATSPDAADRARSYIKSNGFVYRP